jgi:hypothetical protein
VGVGVCVCASDVRRAQQTRVERKSAKDKVHVVQEALGSLKNLVDAGLIDAGEHEKRRAQLLDKLTDVDEVSASDAPAAGAAAGGEASDYDALILPEELRLGGLTLWLAIPRKNLIKYPFGKPFCKPLTGVLVKSREQLPAGADLTPIHCVEIAHDNQARLLGFNRYFFVVVDKDTLEVLNVYRYDQMKRWIFQTFLTVDFGKFESSYFMFRMDIEKARGIQKLLLKYIDLAMASTVAGEKLPPGAVPPKGDARGTDVVASSNASPGTDEPTGWLEWFWQ